MSNETILDVKNLSVSFKTANGEVQAVRDVSFSVGKGETLAIVGESGSGKSVTTKALMGLLPAPKGYIKNGNILYGDKDFAKLSDKQMTKYRGKDFAMIFQDPMTSLNPTMKVGTQVMEGLRMHRGMNKEQAKTEAVRLLELVRIPDAKARMNQYPHQFSGGMRQRVVIAIALACDPKVLIADEPTTALDVTIQAQILDIMKDIQEEFETSIIFITHDLGVVANVADRVAVMYAGKIVEMGSVDELFYNPKHPYTWGLLGSMPTVDQREEELFAIPGTPPDLLHPPKGDAFAPRNRYALKIDYEEQPPMFQVSETHYAATWLLHENSPDVQPPASVQQRIDEMDGKWEAGQ